MVAQFSGNPSFRGTVLVTDDPDFGAPWPPVDAGSVHIRIRFYDVDYYQSVWEPELDNDWVPGFLDEQEAATPTAVEDALYDLDVWQRVDNETAKIVTLRIGAADGAVSYVTQSLIPCDPIPVPPGGADDQRGALQCVAMVAVETKMLSFTGDDVSEAGMDCGMFQTEQTVGSLDAL
jgi:hypothetical protein